MAFGPELFVVRNLPTVGKVDYVGLGGFNSQEMPRFPSEDPTTEYLNSEMARALKDDDISHVLGMMALDWSTILWGVHTEEGLVGFAVLDMDDSGDMDNDFGYYTIVLHPQARNRGVGGLVTEAVLRTGLTEGAFDDTTTWFSHKLAAIGTAIHPDNRFSQQMCERAGFVQIEGEYHRVDGVNFLSYLCDRPASQIATILPS